MNASDEIPLLLAKWAVEEMGFQKSESSGYEVEVGIAGIDLTGYITDNTMINLNVEAQ